MHAHTFISLLLIKIKSVYLSTDNLYEKVFNGAIYPRNISENNGENNGELHMWSRFGSIEKVLNILRACLLDSQALLHKLWIVMDNSIIQSSAYYLVLLRAHLLDISSIIFFVIVYIYISYSTDVFGFLHILGLQFSFRVCTYLFVMRGCMACPVFVLLADSRLAL